LLASLRRGFLVFSVFYTSAAITGLKWGVSILPSPVSINSGQSSTPSVALAAAALACSVLFAFAAKRVDDRSFVNNILDAGIAIDLVLAILVITDLAYLDTLFGIGSSSVAEAVIFHALWLVILRSAAYHGRIRFVYWAGIIFTFVIWFAVPLCPANSCPAPNGSGILPPPPLQ
jgi:hypothetical protein